MFFVLDDAAPHALGTLPVESVETASAALSDRFAGTTRKYGLFNRKRIVGIYKSFMFAYAYHFSVSPVEKSLVIRDFPRCLRFGNH